MYRNGIETHNLTREVGLHNDDESPKAPKLSLRLALISTTLDTHGAFCLHALLKEKSVFCGSHIVTELHRLAKHVTQSCHVCANLITKGFTRARPLRYE